MPEGPGLQIPPLPAGSRRDQSRGRYPRKRRQCPRRRYCRAGGQGGEWGRGRGCAKNLEEARWELDKHKKAIVGLEELYKDINASWGDITRRNIGVLEYSPPSLSTSTTKDIPRIGQPSDSTQPGLGLTSKVMSLTSVRFDSLPISITSSTNKPFQVQKYRRPNSRGSCTPELTLNQRSDSPQTVS